MDREPSVAVRDQPSHQQFWITASILALTVSVGAAAFLVFDVSSAWRVPAFLLQCAAVCCLGFLALRRQAAASPAPGPAHGPIADSTQPQPAKRPDATGPPPAEPRRESRAAENTDVLLWTEDANGRTTFVNKALCVYRGVTEAEALLRHWDEDVHPEDLSANRTTWEMAIARREPWRMEYRYRRFDGVYRWLLEIGQPRYADDGSFAGVLGSCIDISEHREIEAALRATEAELRQARQQLIDGIEGLTDGFALYDKDDCLIAWNSRFAELAGADAVLLKPGVRFESILRNHLRAGRELSAIGREEEWIATRMAQHRDPKGSFERFINGHWYRESDRPTPDGGIVTILAQIDELKLREARIRENQAILQSILDNIPVTVSITDRDRHIVLLNNQIEKLYGVTLEDVVGRHVLDVRPRRFASDSSERDHYSVVATGRPIEAREDKYQGENGEETWITSVVPIKDDAGTVKFVLRTTIEVPQLARANRELADYRAFLIEAERQARIASWYQSATMESAIFWSENVEAVIGYAAEAVSTDAALLDVIHVDDRTRVKALFDQVAIRPSSYEIEFRVVRPDGKTVWIRDITNVALDSQGNLVRFIGTIQDVTGQKRIEEALRDSQELLLTAERRAKIACWTKTENDAGSFVASDLGADVLGIPLDQMPANDAEYLERVHPEDRPKVALAFRRADIEHESYSLEYRFNRGDGETIWVKDLAHFRPAADGKPMWMIGTIQNITDQKRVEEALRTSEARLQAFIDNAPVLMSIKDPQGRFLMLNPKIARSFGLRVEDIVGKSTKDVFPSAGADQIYGMEQMVVATGQPVAGEVNLSARHALPWTYEVKFPIFDAEGKVAAVGGVAIDISDRKKAELAFSESESRLLRAQKQARLAYWSKDLGSQDIQWSKGSGWVCGVSDSDLPATEDAYVSIAHSDDRERIKRNYDRVRSGLDNYSMEYRILRPDGSVVWVQEQGKVERDASGRRVTFDGTLQDITERRALEEQLQQAQKMEAIGQLTGGIAHDFNNLLAIILGNLDLLNEQKELAFSMRRKVETAIKAGMRAADLTHRLLAFARRQALMPEFTEINELIRSMVPLLQRPLGPKIATTFVLDPSTWAAEIDQSQLEMALLNLTLNARDAMPEGGSLTISTGNATMEQIQALTGNWQAAGDYVVISVTDTGTGMPDEVKARAFDPFFTTKDVGKGTGLGLSMVYGFVKQSGGHVQIKSSVGEGTTVSLYLARAGAESAAQEKIDDQPISTGQQEIVLLVEDEADVRVLAETYLESFGYTVISAADGATAMAALTANPRIDLLLSDIILPGTLDGIAIAAHVRATRPEVKIVYMSGYAPDPEMLLPGTELIKKPFLRADLSRVVRAALDRARAA